MKLFKLLALAGISFSLAACNIAKKAPSSSSQDSSIVEPSSSDSSEEGSSSEEEIVEKTIEEVVADINGVFNPLVGSDILDWYEDYGCYIGALNLGAAEATTDEEHVAELQSATEFIVSYLPEYLEIDAAEYEESYDDYYIGLSVDSVGVDNFGYVNGSGNILVQIQVSLIAE